MNGTTRPVAIRTRPLERHHARERPSHQVGRQVLDLHLGELGVAHALGEDLDDRLVADLLEVAGATADGRSGSVSTSRARRGMVSARSGLFLGLAALETVLFTRRPSCRSGGLQALSSGEAVSVATRCLATASRPQREVPESTQVRA